MRRTLVIAVGVCIVVAVTAFARAKSQDYTLQRGVVGSATRDTLQGTGYRLDITVGQPVVGESGAEGSYSVSSGYPAVTESEFDVYLPLVLRYG